MDTQRTAQTILADIAAIPTMERGRLCEMHGTAGRVYHNLQFWSRGRNRCEYVSEANLAAVRDAVANHGQYRRLVEEYATAVEEQTRRARRAGADSPEKKGSATRRPKRRAGKSPTSSSGCSAARPQPRRPKPRSARP